MVESATNEKRHSINIPNSIGPEERIRNHCCARGTKRRPGLRGLFEGRLRELQEKGRSLSATLPRPVPNWSQRLLEANKMRKKLGRPQKKKGVSSFMQFERAGIVMSLYDKARKNGQKHSAAVAQTVELIKHNLPMMRISETEVKRILGTYRPRGSQIIVRFECSMLSGEELAKRYCIVSKLAAISEKKGSKLPAPSDVILPKSVRTYKMYFSERPNYPRHNRKLPKE